MLLSQLQRAFMALFVSLKSLVDQTMRRVALLYHRSVAQVVQWAAVVWNILQLREIMRQPRQQLGRGKMLVAVIVGGGRAGHESS